MFEKGLNSWIFTLDLRNLEDGTYVFGFLIKFADSSYKINHKNSSIYFGSRIINSLHISNSYISVPKMIPKKKRYKLEDIPIENRRLEEFRKEYYENVKNYKDFSGENIKFLNNLLKE